MQRERKASQSVELGRLRRALAAAEAEIDRLKAAAETDPVVKLANRRGFETELKRSLSFLQRYRGKAGLLYLDVAGLKAVNDRHGHAAGDRVLRHVAATIKRLTRRSDFAGRLGGDEFGVILWNVSAAELRHKAETLAAAVAARAIRFGTARLRPGIVAGGTMLRASDTVRGAIARADRAMYRAKAKQDKAKHDKAKQDKRRAA